MSASGPFSRAMTFAAADLKDDDGIKTTIATAATAQSYSGAALNGTTVAANVAYPRPAATDWDDATGRQGVVSWPSATASSNAGSYVDASTVTFTGTYNGEAVTRTATVSGTDGGATYVADGPMDTVTQIDVEPQVNTGGAWTFGWSGLGPEKRQTDGAGTGSYRLWTVLAREDGNLHTADFRGEDDTTPLLDGNAHFAHVTRIYADTAIQITIYEE